ncbi:MAG: polyisoprenoid-binding protein [Pseudonocardia sp.]|nr:polyisoprenoid-binding protein [Pseudonocardia sp.]
MTVTTHPFSGTFVADPVHSSLSFTVTHMMVSRFRASFADVEATAFTSDDGVHIDGSIGVESVSITTPEQFREHVVYGKDFFDARQYPRITFRSTKVDLAPDGKAGVDVELTIKGITRPVQLTGQWIAPVEDLGGRLRGAVTLSATVDRRDWDITWQAPLPKGGDALGTEVTLEAQVELIEQTES